MIVVYPWLLNFIVRHVCIMVRVGMRVLHIMGVAQGMGMVSDGVRMAWYTMVMSAVSVRVARGGVRVRLGMCVRHRMRVVLYCMVVHVAIRMVMGKGMCVIEDVRLGQRKLAPTTQSLHGSRAAIHSLSVTIRIVPDGQPTSEVGCRVTEVRGGVRRVGRTVTGAPSSWNRGSIEHANFARNSTVQAAAVAARLVDALSES
jgi:hypothetical protein